MCKPLQPLFQIISILSLMLLLSCGGKQIAQEEKDSAAIHPQKSATAAEFMTQGRKISSWAQSSLLTKVKGALKTGGTTHAIQFCNVNVKSMMDSLSQGDIFTISRISNKNRSPYNGPTSKLDNNILAFFEGAHGQGRVVSDTLIASEHEQNYYRPIHIGLPACLKCHGAEETEITQPTFEVLDELYPNDLAKNYKMGDFRGAWKIVFAEK